jgi:glycosyltransferase involved in cell wall biosynthesis
MANLVLHIITGLDGGGAERMLTRVASTCHASGTRQVVISLTDDGVYGASLRAAGIPLHCLKMRRAASSFFTCLPRLVTLIRHYRPDVVMTWLYRADLMGTFATVLAGVGLYRLVWNLRCSNLDFSHFSAWTRLTVRLLALMSRLPAAVVANSRAGITHHARLGYRPRQWAYLPNGFDLDEWRPDPTDRAAVRAEWGFDDDVIAIGMVARVDPQKAHQTFFAAAEALAATDRRLRFVLVGLGTETLAPPPCLVGGTLLALGERHDLQRLLRGMDFVVLPSKYGEGFPNVIGEAMATGVPCVVSDVGDAAVLVKGTGGVAPPSSAADLAAALSRLLMEPLDSRRNRGKAARTVIQTHFELTNVAARYVELFRLIARKRSANEMYSIAEYS